jgi:sugar lactone lactonase YvrE
VTAPVVVDGGVWTADPATGAVTRFALDGGAATATIDQPIEDLAAGAGALWSVSTNIFGEDRHLDRRDPATGEVVASVPAIDGRIVAGPDEVWYADATFGEGGRLQRVDPATLAFGEPFHVEVPLFSELVVGEGRLWWMDVDQLTTIDLATGTTSEVELPGMPDAVGGGAAGVWTVDGEEAVARRVEGGEAVHTVDIPDGWWLATVTADGTVWLAGRGPDGEHPQALRLDPTVTGA